MSNPKAFPCDAGVIRSGPSVPACARRRIWVLTAAVMGSTLAFVDESVVNVALPKIEGDLHTTLAAMQWVINAYTLCMSALLLLGGAAADRFGRRLIFVIGVSIFAAASLGCGLAANVQPLIAARAVQGAGAALLIPCSLALIGAAYDEKERGAAIGIWSGASAIAAGAAPLLGGWLVDHWSWRVIFLINPLLAIPTLWIALRQVPESRDPNAPAGIDWRGAVLAFAGLGCLVYGLIASSGLGWGHATVLTSVSVGAILLVAFLLVERGAASPMMPLELFRSRTFSAVNLLTLLLYGALGAAFFFLPFLLIQARGYSATAAGGAYLPFTLVLGLLSRWSGRLVDRFGARRPLMAGPALTACGFALLGSGDARYGAVLLCMTVLGLGMAITVAPLTTAVINAVPPQRTGVASGINNAVASLGGLLLIAVLGTLALPAFDHALERQLSAREVSPGVRAAVEAARGGFVLPAMPAGITSEERQRARSIVADSLAGTINGALWIAAALALAGALSAAVGIKPPPRLTTSPPRSGADPGGAE
ncbi:MAG TPA: MFS transporter [Steroidobacteraceae bacterium]|nr:MFS transporter [Steroidobacteraceae bacterium]